MAGHWHTRDDLQRPGSTGGVEWMQKTLKAEVTCMCTEPLRDAGRLPDQRCTGGRLKLTWRFVRGSHFCGALTCPALPDPGAGAAESGSSVLVAESRDWRSIGCGPSECSELLLCVFMCSRSMSRNCLHAAGH